MPGPTIRHKRGGLVPTRGRGRVITDTGTRPVQPSDTPSIPLHTLKRTPGTPQYAKRQANIARRGANQAARATRRVPLASIPHLSPTLGALQQQTHNELIDHAANSDEALRRVMHHLASQGIPELKPPKALKPSAKEPRLHLTPEQKRAARSLAKRGIPDLAKNPAGRHYQRQVAVEKYKQGEPLTFREQARAERTLIRRGKSQKLRPQDRALASTPFGPGPRQVEAQVRAQRQGRRLASEHEGGGVGGALDKLKNEGLLGLVAPGAARAGRKIVYGTANPSTAQVGIDLGLTLAGGRVLGRAAEAGGPLLGRTVGKVFSRAGGRAASEGLGIVGRAKYAATRAAAAEAGVELGGSTAGRVARTVAKAEKAGGAVAPTRAGTAASLGSKVAGAVGVGGAGKYAARFGESGAGKALRAVGRHKGKALLAAGPGAQIPAVVSTGDPTQFGKAFTGKGAAIQGVTKAISKPVAAVAPAGIARNLVQDIFSLPAQALPSIYLPLAGLVEASRGDPARLKSLWADYKKIGLLPAVASGNPSKVLKAIENHPLFSALEASGVYAAAGRGAGALGRAAGSRAASTGGRRPLEISPGTEPIQRGYSKNILTKAFQVARDRREKVTPEGTVRAGSKHGLRGPERDRLLRDRTTSFMGGEEASRRAGRSAIYETAKDLKPKAGEDVVSEVGQHFVLGTDVETFRHSALQRADRLDAIYKQKTDPALPADERFNAGERELNRKLAGDLRASAKLPDEKVQGILDAAKGFQGEHSVHSAATQELIGRHPEQITHEQARRAALIPYATEHEGHTFARSNATEARIGQITEELRGNPKDATALRSERAKLYHQNQLLDPHGNPANYDALEARLRDRGLGSPAFLSHRQGVRGPGAHYQPVRDRGSLARQRRTGQAGREGTYDASFASIEDQLAHTFTTTHRSAQYDRLLSRFGIEGHRPETGQRYMPTVSRMDEVNKINTDPAYAKEVYGIDLPEGEQVAGVRLTPLFARARSAAGVKQLVTEEKGLEQPDVLNPSAAGNADSTALARWNEATSGKGEGPIALIPETVKKEIDAHLEQRSSLGKLFEAYNSGFKTVVLPTSSKWFEGNMAEAAIRSVFSGLTPHQYWIGKRVLSTYEEMFGPDAARAFHADVITGSHYSSRNFTRKYRTSEQVAGTAEAPVFRAFEAIARHPTVSTVMRGFNAYAGTIFRLNGWLERQPQIAALGKFAQEELHRNNVGWGKAVLAQGDAIRGLLEGQRPGGELQVRAAKEVQGIFGNWTHNTPKMRRFLADYSPFGLWLRAATKYVFWTLPRHHPIKTAILASMEEMTQDERRKLGLDLFHSTGAGSLPSDAFGVPLSGGGVFPTGAITSFGTSQQVLSGGAGNFILPQFAQILRGGVNWAGDKLVHPDGTPLSDPEKFLVIAEQTLEPLVPFSSDIRRVREGGRSPSPISTVFQPSTRKGSKPHGSIAQKILGISSLTPSTVAYLRRQNQLRDIQIPAHSGGSSDPFGHLFGSGSSGSSSDPFSHLFK